MKVEPNLFFSFHVKTKLYNVVIFRSHETRFRPFSLAGGEENNFNQNNKNNTDDQMNSSGDDSTESQTGSSSFNSS